MNKLNAWTFDGRLIGNLSSSSVDGGLDFDYADDWVNSSDSYPISPSIPFRSQAGNLPMRRSAIARYFNNLLPEGNGLDDIARMGSLSKSNLFGLLKLIGQESSGAMMLLPSGMSFGEAKAETSLRPLPKQELSERIRSRPVIPFSVWDEKVRLSVAGYQDKIGVLIHKEDLFLVEYPLASTHILKPMPVNTHATSLVANEHFCMMLSAFAGVKTANTHIIRVPEPVLAVSRFDRLFRPEEMKVSRSHVIDGCQFLDLPIAYKYEHNFGSSEDVKHIRDGASLKKIFDLNESFDSPALFKIDMLRWTLIQYLVGNADAHGKNISFHVEPGGKLKVAPAYDVVCTAIYPGFDDKIAMSIGDEFKFADIGAYHWADFAQECGIPRRRLGIEMEKMSLAIEKNAPELAANKVFISDEKDVLEQIVEFALNQSKQMKLDSKLIGSVMLDVICDIKPSNQQNDLAKQGSITGKILRIEGDVIVQKKGRDGDEVQHDASKLSAVPKVDAVVNIKYGDDGRATVTDVGRGTGKEKGGR